MLPSSIKAFISSIFISMGVSSSISTTVLDDSERNRFKEPTEDGEVVDTLRDENPESAIELLLGCGDSINVLNGLVTSLSAVRFPEVSRESKDSYCRNEDPETSCMETVSESPADLIRVSVLSASV